MLQSYNECLDSATCLMKQQTDKTHQCAEIHIVIASSYRNALSYHAIIILFYNAIIAWRALKMGNIIHILFAQMNDLHFTAIRKKSFCKSKLVVCIWITVVCWRLWPVWVSLERKFNECTVSFVKSCCVFSPISLSLAAYSQMPASEQFSTSFVYTLIGINHRVKRLCVHRVALFCIFSSRFSFLAFATEIFVFVLFALYAFECCFCFSFCFENST